MFHMNPEFYTNKDFESVCNRLIERLTTIKNSEINIESKKEYYSFLYDIEGKIIKFIGK